MRYSQQREKIKEIMYNTNSHPTADWIFEMVQRSIPNISLGTVYRNLKQLTENGDIRTLKDGDVIRYDGNLHRHDHLLCTQCNNVYDIDILPKDLDIKAQTQFNFDVSNVSLTIEGICQNH